VALETEGNDGTTTTGGAESSQDEHLFDLVEWLLLGLELVPALMVQELANKFDRWLGSIFFLLGHVEIVDEAAETLSYFGSIDLITPLSHFVIKEVLSLVS
jgi:hypothetical protein